MKTFSTTKQKRQNSLLHIHKTGPPHSLTTDNKIHGQWKRKMRLFGSCGSKIGVLSHTVEGICCICELDAWSYLSSVFSPIGSEGAGSKELLKSLSSLLLVRRSFLQNKKCAEEQRCSLILNLC